MIYKDFKMNVNDIITKFACVYEDDAEVSEDDSMVQDIQELIDNL